MPKLFSPCFALWLGVVSMIFDAGAETGADIRFVQVTGTSKQMVEPDSATLILRLRPVSNTLEESSERLKIAVQALEARLAEAGMPEGSLRLSGISSGRSYDGRVFNGFFAERRVTVRLSDLAQRPVLEKALLQDELVEIMTVQLRTSKHEEWRKASLVSAFEVAKEKAELLAVAAGLELGAVLSIDEQTPIRQNSFWGPGLTENRIEMPVFGAGPGADLEWIEYAMSVTVRFALR